MNKLNHLEFMLNQQTKNIFESSKSNKKLDSFNQNVFIQKSEHSGDSFTSSSVQSESIDDNQINNDPILEIELTSPRRSQSLNSK